MSEPVLRRAGPDDSEGISRLLASTNPDNPKSDPEVLRWQYWQNPFTDAWSWVWEADGSIVCHYALIPVPLQTGQGFAIGVIGVDAATLESHRGRGLFGKLVVEALAVAQRAPAAVTLNYRAPDTRLPSDATIGSASAIDLRVLPISHAWLSKRLRWSGPAARAATAMIFRPPRGEPAKQIDRPPTGLDKLWEAVADRYPYSIAKVQQWWDWRYGARPRATYRYFERREGARLLGAAVAVPPDNERTARVLELMASDEGSARSLIAGVVDAFAGAEAIALRATRGSPADRLARSAGLRRVPRRLDAHAPRLWVVAHYECARELERAPWFISWGDMDHL